MARLFSRSRSHNQLRDQLLRQLEQEGQKIMKTMLADFNADLGKQLEQAMQSAFGSSGAKGSNSGGFSADSFSNLLGTAVSYALSRPRTSTHTRESDRSRQMAEQFRLSRSQAAAEAEMALGKAGKNG